MNVIWPTRSRLGCCMSYGSWWIKWIQAQTRVQTYKESAIICPKPPVTAGQLHQKIDPGNKKFWVFKNGVGVNCEANQGKPRCFTEKKPRRLLGLLWRPNKENFWSRKVFEENDWRNEVVENQARSGKFDQSKPFIKQVSDKVSKSKLSGGKSDKSFRMKIVPQLPYLNENCI